VKAGIATSDSTCLWWPYGFSLPAEFPDALDDIGS
jgi:hypothetical protein